MASPEYQTYAKGLNPSKEKHEAFLEIEPANLSTLYITFLSRYHPIVSDPPCIKYSSGDHYEIRTLWCLLQKSGLLLHAANRIQLNIFMINIPELDLLRNVSEGLFPVMWIDEVRPNLLRPSCCLSGYSGHIRV
ncbi:unnamed protein product [Timema podura]|uniref:Maturase K n=1 Tax=Timema podura TaxID=61482 RepID=A0ABN7PDS7_TIMPD|nr:unnamed protein product [Timema podura]